MPQLPTTKGEPLAVPSLPLPATPRPALQPLFPTGNETSGNPDEESASHAGNGPSPQLSPTIHTPDAAPKGLEGDVQKSPNSLSLVNATVPQGDGTGNEMDDKQDRDSGDDGGYLPRGGATMRQPITLQDTTPTADAHNGHVTRDTEGEGESGESVEGPTHGGESEESGPGGRRAL